MELDKRYSCCQLDESLTLIDITKSPYESTRTGADQGEGAWGAHPPPQDDLLDSKINSIVQKKQQ